MKLKFIVPALLAGLVAFTSCSKEDKKEEKKILMKDLET